MPAALFSGQCRVTLICPLGEWISVACNVKVNNSVVNMANNLCFIGGFNSFISLDRQIYGKKRMVTIGRGVFYHVEIQNSFKQ